MEAFPEILDSSVIKIKSMLTITYIPWWKLIQMYENVNVKHVSEGQRSWCRHDAVFVFSSHLEAHIIQKSLHTQYT